MQLPDILWCDIPAGEFIMGSDDGWDHEKPQHTVTLPYRYRVAKYPVTNMQYGLFIAAGGYQDPRYWTEAGWAKRNQNEWTEPRYWRDDRYNQSNQPVVAVSWYEAVAYCNWLTEQLRQVGELSSEWLIRLPTEAEWEKAARGPAGRTYPWGNEFDESHFNMDIGDEPVEQPTAVGLYPTGGSPYGLHDCAGNVWEWCATKYDDDGFKPYPYDVQEAEWGADYLEGTSFRVVRGCSWWSSPEERARCAYRYRDNPNYGSSGFGFRIVCAPCFAVP